MTDLRYGRKFCKKCRTLKPLTSFPSSENKRFNVHAWCKDCLKKYWRERRQKVLDLFGNKCVYCGCDLYDALQINHKYGGGSRDPAGVGTKLISAILSGRRKTDDLELACYVCNARHKLVELDHLPDNWTVIWKSSYD